MNHAKTQYDEIQKKLLTDSRLLPTMKDEYEKLSQAFDNNAHRGNYLEICIFLSIAGGVLIPFIVLAKERNPIIRIALIIAMCVAFCFSYVYYKRHQTAMSDYVFHAYLYKRIIQDSIDKIYDDELTKEEDELRIQADLVTEHILEPDGSDATHDALRLALLTRSYLHHSHEREQMSIQACDDFTIYCSVEDII